LQIGQTKIKLKIENSSKRFDQVEIAYAEIYGKEIKKVIL
jgi:hypothetical protein